MGVGNRLGRQNGDATTGKAYECPGSAPVERRWCNIGGGITTEGKKGEHDDCVVVEGRRMN
jgi:hypothetical protein